MPMYSIAQVRKAFEKEPKGPMPGELWEAAKESPEKAELLLRASIYLTKAAIFKALTGEDYVDTREGS